MTLTRRRFLGVLGGTGAAAALVSCGVGLTVNQTGELVRSEIPLPRPFRVPLPVPPVKRPLHTDATTDYYEIVSRTDPKTAADPAAPELCRLGPYEKGPVGDRLGGVEMMQAERDRLRARTRNRTYRETRGENWQAQRTQPHIRNSHVVILLFEARIADRPAGFQNGLSPLIVTRCIRRRAG